ncbi:YggT family protein [Parolsenella catena]|uniref:Cell division membrane protein n=1 Tax=Parolsenella catena TaxID=2003188 RepID=A0A3G9JXF9_9ACTN|nr:YggT family protein [Parolsenella catena]BBH50063.1 cell division membrane protein [Parolsenella catena]
MDAYRLINLISALVNFYEWLVIIWCFMSWFPLREGSLMYDVAVVIDRIVSPYMNLFRRFIPPLGGMDFSPIVGLFVLSFGERLIFRLLLGMA